MATLIPFFIVLFAGLFFSEIFRRFHFPWVITLMLAGVIIGPQGLRLFTPNETITFIGQIGLVFLMFMAGLEAKFSHFRQLGGKFFLLAFLLSALPFGAGFMIAQIFGYSTLTGVFLGIVFASSSIAVVIPTMEQTGIIKSKLGKSVVSATIVVDIASLALLSMLLHRLSPVTTLPLPVYYLLLLVALIVLRWVIIRAQQFLSSFAHATKQEESLFQDDVRTVFALLIGTVIVFQFFGLHPITAGFFAGLVLAEVIKSSSMRRKLQGIAYGLFIPTFFVIVGAQTDISVFFQHRGALILTLVIVVVSILSKFIGGLIGGRLIGFTLNESIFIGVSGIAQLSTTLAVAMTGAATGILSTEVLAALVVLSSLTTFIGPVLIKILSPKHKMAVEQTAQSVAQLKASTNEHL